MKPIWTRTGTASGSPVSVRALAFIMVGHVTSSREYSAGKIFVIEYFFRIDAKSGKNYEKITAILQK